MYYDFNDREIEDLEGDDMCRDSKETFICSGCKDGWCEGCIPDENALTPMSFEEEQALEIVAENAAGVNDPFIFLVEACCGGCDMPVSNCRCKQIEDEEWELDNRSYEDY